MSFDQNRINECNNLICNSTFSCQRWKFLNIFGWIVSFYFNLINVIMCIIKLETVQNTLIKSGKQILNLCNENIYYECGTYIYIYMYSSPHSVYCQGYFTGSGVFF